MIDFDNNRDGANDYFIMEWIEAKDELPKPHETVIVYMGGNCKGSIDIKYLPEHKRGHHFGWYPGGLELENVTHWMPLPPIPKPEG